MNSPVVELAGASKTYGRVTALDSLDLSVAEGETLGLLGHNGAGKTTAMKLILGVAPVSAGQVRVFGHDPCGKQARQLRFQLGYLPENVRFYEQLSGREVLAFFGRLKKVRPAQLDELLARVGLGEAAERRVKTYSKGMRQRLGLAQALLGEPRLLLLDEPTVGLDPIATRDFYTLLDELREKGVTVLLCSHVLAGIEKHIDRVAILGQGRLLATGTLAELRIRSGLPLRIRVRGHWGDDGLRRFESMRVCARRINGSQLELHAPAEAKMSALRELLANPATQDIDVEQPSLESLYVYFGAESGSMENSPAGEVRCRP